MSVEPPIRDRQILTGSLFSEPMRVETVRANGAGAWVAGLVGTHTERFHSVTLNADDIASLTITDSALSYDGDGRMLRLGLEARSLGIAHEFDPCFGLSISRVDPLPHQLEAVYEHLLKRIPRTVGFTIDDAEWDHSVKPAWLDAGRTLVKAAHGEDPPLVVDPFAGGGSIPLEALRLGCEPFASDLNPVACLILKVMLEDIPRHGPGLADELREAGTGIKAAAERELAGLYPTDPDGATPIAYLWARTVRCEAPDCGAEIPLMRSFWLCKKPKRRRALRHSVKRVDGLPPRVAFEVFEPRSETEVRAGTVTHAKATCLCCGAILPPERVRAQLAAERGGADVIFDAHGHRVGGVRMTAVVTLKPWEKGRHYRVPTNADYAAVHKAQERVAGVLEESERARNRGCARCRTSPYRPSVHLAPASSATACSSGATCSP